MSSRKITIYTGPKCHLCEQAKAILYPLVTGRDMQLVEVNIQTDAELKAQYGIRIPVVAMDDGREKDWPFTAAQIFRMLS